MREQIEHIENYLKAVAGLYKTGIVAEHSYRGVLCDLLAKLTDYQVINEAKRIGCGAPDLTLLDKNRIPVGFVEAKDVGKNLNDRSYHQQFTRYKKALDNLIITDYLTFQYFKGEELIAKTVIGEEQNGKIVLQKNNFDKFIEIIHDFSRYNGKPIKNSEQLAEFMAAKTGLLAETILKTLETDENSSLHSYFNGFKDVLLPKITFAQFADMYAQTIAYGLFVARLNDNQNTEFTREKAVRLIPISNPFLKRLFKYTSDEDNIDQNIEWLINSLADMFNYTAIDNIRKEFVSRDKDPFLHFYEDFLTKYDKNLKNAKGAFYTPQAVVTFIVNAVDDILKADFKLSKGLADNSKVFIKDKEYHKVQILDPATGTGTFLAEVLRKIHKEYENNEGIWNTDVNEHILKRLNGFEIMMSPYTMAHLKLEMLLQEFGYKPVINQRLQIFLTDSLDTPKEEVPELFMAKWLSDEAAEALKIKQEMPVMVVLGNPPYLGESQNKSDWILKLMKEYKIDDKGHVISGTKWINNDYKKFMRFGQFFIDKNKEGILAYITPNGFLSDQTDKGIRYNLLRSFDEIYIVNLHGSQEKQNLPCHIEKDENVFDIGESVSINIFVTTGKKDKKTLAKVFYFDIYGKRQEKYNFLLNNNITKIQWKLLQPQTPDYFFIPKDFSLKEEYEKGFKIDELFDVHSQGIVPSNKHFTIQNTKKDLENSIKDFLNLSDKEALEKYKLSQSRDWKVAYAKKELKTNFSLKNITKYHDFPFDAEKYTYYTGKSKGFLCYPRGKVMNNFFNQNNIGLVVAKECQDDWKYVFITNKICALNLTGRAQKYGAGFVFPLYMYIKNGIADNDTSPYHRKNNIKQEIINELSKQLKLVFAEDNEVSGKTFTPIDIFDYVYAVLHSPTYRKKYNEFLKIDFPRIPCPKNAKQFRKLTTFGEKLRKLHLLEDIDVPNNFANYPIQGNDEIENKFTETSNDFRDGKVWINTTQYFDNVPAAAWNFYIGGYQPAQKWLKDRKGGKLEEKEHYRKIIYALAETTKIMDEKDEVYKN